MGDYEGRRGLGPGAFADSAVHVWRLVSSWVHRKRELLSLASRLGELEREERALLLEIGRTALFLADLESPVLRPWRVRQEELDGRRRETEASLEALRARMRAVEEERDVRLAEERDRLAALKKERAALQRTLDDVIGDIEAVERRIGRLESERQLLEESGEAGVEKRLARIRREVAGWRERQEELGRELTRLDSERQRLDERLAAVRERIREQKQASDAQLWELHQQCRQAEGLLEELAAEKEALVFECGQAVAANRVAHPALEGRYEALDALREEQEALEARRVALKAHGLQVHWPAVARVALAAALLAGVVASLFLCAP